VSSQRSLRRFYVFPDAIHDTDVTIEGQEAVHCLQVLRLRCGDECELFDGYGTVYAAKIIATEKPAVVRARIASILTQPVSRPYHISLIQAVGQRGIFDTVIAKATELSVDTVIPLYSERTINKCPAQKRDAVGNRWKKISIQAAKQSHTARLPDITIPSTLPAVLERQHAYAAIISPVPGAMVALGAVMKRIGSLPRSPANPLRLAVIIGPEGGMTPEEIAMMKRAGTECCSLSDTILRTDTAMVACIGAIVQFLIA